MRHIGVCRRPRIEMHRYQAFMCGTVTCATGGIRWLVDSRAITRRVMRPPPRAESASTGRRRCEVARFVMHMRWPTMLETQPFGTRPSCGCEYAVLLCTNDTRPQSGRWLRSQVKTRALIWPAQ